MTQPTPEIDKPHETEQARTYPDIWRLFGPPQTVQMWARVGYALPVGPAPRRGRAAQLVRAQSLIDLRRFSGGR